MKKATSDTKMSENFTKNLPPKFIQNISGLYGAKGKKWLKDLPDILAEICQKWSLQIDKVFPNLSFNFVALCVNKSGEKYVLKVGVPEKDSSIIYEKRALQVFDGEHHLPKAVVAVIVSTSNPDD